MATCTKWITNVVITCENWASEVEYTCTTWAEEGSEECSQWAEEGSEECSQWADEGSEQCSAWEECHWYTPWNCIAGFFCLAWYWVAKWVCKAWYWVAKWVCLAWYWLAKWVCKAFTWIVRAVCVVFGWVVSVVCVAWETLRCAWLAVWHDLFGGGRQRERAMPQIDHVFVVMLENRAFDHMFGFSGLEGIDTEGNPTTIDGADPSRDKNVDPLTNEEVPVSTPADFALKGLDVDPGHEFHDTLVSLCGEGATYNPVPGGYPEINNSGFIDNYRDSGSGTPERIMHCYTPEQLPVLHKLAEEFAICDQWFSSLPGPTWPNRFFLLAASSGGLDGSPSTADIIAATTVDGYRFSNGTIFDLLDEYCIDWKIYAGDDFPVSYALAGMTLNALEGRFADFNDFPEDVNGSDFGPQFVFIEPKYGSHAFDITGPGDFTCGDSMHPLDDVTRGERLVKTIYEAIRNSPQWEHSMLLVVFDEHGGFYDHVEPPPGVPPGDTITERYVQNHFQFDQLGVRVPALVISPLIEQGVIDHTQYDHSSMLASVERLFGMHNLTNRDQAANDFLHLLSRASPREDTPETLPDPAVNPKPLGCDDESEDELIKRRSELREAKSKGRYRERAVEDVPLTPSQVGFVQVALLRVLENARAPQRSLWIEQYKDISTGVDAALFMTEARLKLDHGIDFKSFESPHNPDIAARRRATAAEQASEGD
jgi:phospholipase C